MADNFGFRVVAETHADEREHRRQIASLLNAHARDKVGITRVAIADDQVGQIKPPVTGGFLILVMGGDTDTPEHAHSGFLYYDVGTDLKIEKNTGFATVAGSLDVVTTDVIGTSGTDGNVTVSAQTGVLKIENRFGSAKVFQVIFL